MEKTWWLPRQKHYLAETRYWYCPGCEKITRLEHNPEWDGKFKGLYPIPEWFARCAICKHEYYQMTEFDCPNCGWDGAGEDDDKNSMISSTTPVYNSWKAYEFGGHPVDWEETHLCPICGTEFTFMNSNC